MTSRTLGMGTSTAAQPGAASALTTAIPGRRTRPATRNRTAAASPLTGTTAAPQRPMITTTDPKIGSVIGFATTATSDTWWKWNAVSGAVPTSAQGETRAADRIRA